jgi:hypothetical protein
MNIDWDKWEAIEATQNRLNYAVSSAQERLADADMAIRAAETSLSFALSSNGVFRKLDLSAWMRDFNANPEGYLRQYADHGIIGVLRQHVEARTKRQRAADALEKATQARNQHSASYFQLRDWVTTQQQRGII